MGEEFEISDDPARLDLDVIMAFMARTYWAKDMPRAQMARAIAGSLNFGVYLRDGGRQIGFARVITDRATFSYLSDVFIDEAYRGRGLSVRLVEHIYAHPDLQGFRRHMLLTSDAHRLYEKIGFGPPAHPEWIMERT
jgi:GNAT superfamily N-acetyltransferase